MKSLFGMTFARQGICLITFLTFFFGTFPAHATPPVYSPVFYYYHQDGLGTSTVMTDRNGEVVQRYGHYAYGTERYRDNSTAYAVSNRYTGQVSDEDTGLYYYNARYYDPELGRFIQPDGIVPEPHDPQSHNRYSYVRNDPLNRIDPSGNKDEFSFSYSSGGGGSGINWGGGGGGSSSFSTSWSGSSGFAGMGTFGSGMSQSSRSGSGSSNAPTTGGFSDLVNQGTATALHMGSWSADVFLNKEAFVLAYDINCLSEQILMSSRATIGHKAMAVGGLAFAAILVAAFYIDIANPVSKPLAIAKPGIKGAVKVAAKEAPLLLTQGTRVPNAGGVIRSFVQETDQVYYRVFSGSQQGSFLTAVKPGSSEWARQALALPAENTAAFVQEVLVPAGTRLQRSRALPAFGARGGAEQFELLEHIPTQNFGAGVPLQ